MSRIINDEQLSIFITLLRSDIDRLDEIIANVKYDDVVNIEELNDLVKERSKYVDMCLALGGDPR